MDSGRGHHRRRSRAFWPLIAIVVSATYVATLVGATVIAFAAAAALRPYLASADFRRYLRAVEHPVTVADLPRMLPGIPIYPGAKLDPALRPETEKSEYGREVSVCLMAPASPAQILSFYRRHMAGWEPSPRRSEDDHRLTFERGNDRCSISILSLPDLLTGLTAGGQTSFAVRYYSYDFGGTR